MQNSTTHATKNSTELILEERQKTHGDFKTHALITQSLKKAATEHAVSALSHVQAEALEMIIHKIGRILNGNPNHKDHWADIAGYATLVSREL